jgi:hypothetical protein
MLLINNQTVEQILDMKGCMAALETGYRDLINERAVYRGRYDMFVPNDDPKLMYRWGTMEGASRSLEDSGKILHRARNLLRHRHGFFHSQWRAFSNHQ